VKEYTIKISRYNPEVDKKPTIKDYRVPNTDQGTVLEALLYVYEEIDSELLFSYGCRYKLCGKCAIKINGKPALGCETPLKEGMILEPLDQFPVIRDLAVDRSGLIEPLRKHHILFVSSKELEEVVIQPPEFFQAIKCNECLACLSNCPVFSQGLDYDGPFFGVKLAELYYDVRDGEDRIRELESYSEKCILCKRCDGDCPWGVNFSELSTKIKGELYGRRRSSIRDWIFSHPSFVGNFETFLFPFSNFLVKQKPFRKMLGRFVGIHEKAFLPEYHPGRIRKWQKKESRKKRKVAYFLGCFDKFNDPVTAEDSISIMEANNITIEAIDLGCCGLPFIGVGNLQSAENRAVEVSKKLKKLLTDGYDILLSCPSCGSMIRNLYPRLFHQMMEEKIQKRIHDIGEYLLEMVRSDQLNANFKRIEKKIGYHVPCHLKSQEMGTPFVDLLNLIPGLKIDEVFDQCCGMAGTMGLKKEKYEFSRKVGGPLISLIEKGKFDLILSDCASCRMRIESEAEVKTSHSISILKESMK
jgi:glycerol-3-phosphate dehydrogenase subunit C